MVGFYVHIYYCDVLYICSKYMDLHAHVHCALEAIQEFPQHNAA